jgi:son of sevenless-like protein
MLSLHILIPPGLQECRKLRNFSSMAAIISALQSDAVQRLTKTKKEVPDRLMAGLEKLVRPDNNFQSYQAALKESAAPCVPWLGEHLTLPPRHHY